MPKMETFLDVEAAVTRLFHGYADKAARATVGAVMARMKEGDVDAANAAARSFDMERYYPEMEKRLIVLYTSAMILGASRFGPAKKTELFKAGGNQELVAATANQARVLMGAVADLVWESAKVVIAEEELRQKDASQQVQKTESGVIKDFRRAMNTAVTQQAKNSVAITAGLHASRLATYGFLMEATMRGQTTYRIDEQLDKRTCPFCRMMDGRVYTVEPALHRVEIVLMEDNVDVIKAMAPFPAQNKASLAEYEQMTADELRAQGLDLPPYHPYCRGQVDITTTTEMDLIDRPRTFADALATSVFTPVQVPSPLEYVIVNGHVIRGSELPLSGPNVIEISEVSGYVAGSAYTDLLYGKASDEVAGQMAESMSRAMDKVSPLGVTGPTFYTKSPAMVSAGVTGAGLSGDEKTLEAVVAASAVASLTNQQLTDLKATIKAELGPDASDYAVAKAVTQSLLDQGYDVLVVPNPLYGDTVVILNGAVLKLIGR